MKKLLCMLLALTVVLVAFAGIASAEEAARLEDRHHDRHHLPGRGRVPPPAEALKEKYPDNVITDTYPDQYHGRAGDHHLQAARLRH